MEMKLRGICNNCKHTFDLMYIENNKSLGVDEEKKDLAQCIISRHRFEPPICPKCGRAIISATEICMYVSVEVLDPSKSS